MIARLDGTVASIQENSVILLTAGIGFEIFTPNIHAVQLGTHTHFYIHLHWNQENGPTLFGFCQEYEKRVFELIISCPGIGPRIAIGMLTHTSAEQIIHAIVHQEDKILSALPGIGKKKAEQIVLFLKNKVEKLVEKGIVPIHHTTSDLQQLSEVLNSLDYSKAEIQDALHYIKQEQNQTISFDSKLRKTLNYLSRRQ